MANDGHLFSWDDPPETGHPGADYNCRCQALAYVPGETEFAFHTMSELESSSPYRWIDPDFVAHYFLGNGVAVTLAEVGHLREIVEQYAYLDKGEGTFRRLSTQIAIEARTVRNGGVSLDFNNNYDFGDVGFSHGFGVVKGAFNGTTVQIGPMLRIEGWSRFEFTDRFEDPVGLGIEVGGDPYDISGRWSASFTAEILVDSSESNYR